ncbi:transglycosylase domain-containing protein [Kurthia sibirica]|uniref:transglycosylase domain-containing protein n=1 Tax=Kurthia sibirica TaxID=202750 RepID=UPI0027D956E3|nr:transglycosylase domain-containing protein [Kurthia sibirica]
MFGILLIIGMLPLIVFLFTKIGVELKSASAFSKQFSSSVQMTEKQAVVPTLLRDDNNNTFSEEYTEWREPLKLADIPTFAQQLFVQSEDAGFYEHMGFDLTAIARAFMANNDSGVSSQGGSTITQQLVRMRYLSQEKTYERKMLEIFYAYEIEQRITKDEILNSYLNEMYFANGVYGIGGAATYYFDKPLKDLSKAEITFISAIPNNPSLYNPLRFFDNTKKRQLRLLNKLVEKNVISEEKATQYKKEPITLKIKKKKQLYPAYSTYVMSELRSLISEVDGFHKLFEEAKTSPEVASLDKKLTEKVNAVINQGVIIQTALDVNKQNHDTQATSALLANRGKLQASATVIDNNTREVVSIYGGKNYRKFDFNRAYQAKRQPGSAIKPLLDYAPYLEKFKVTADSVINGAPFCKGDYCPKNYGNITVDNITMRTAFKNSYNTAAIRLFDRVGMDKAFSYLQPFAFDRAMKNDLSYSAAIGGFTHGVSSYQLADAYTSFINGNYNRSHAIRTVKTRDGKLLYEWPEKNTQIWSPSTVTSIRSLMAETVSSGTGQGISSSSDYIGVKTGTTNEYKDYWLAGLSSQYTAAVWLGYDTPIEMEALEKERLHHKIFSAIMK